MLARAVYLNSLLNMQIRFSKDFLRHFDRLPKAVKIKAESQVVLLQVDQEHPYLHTKKLQGKPTRHSCRVGREYRILFETRDTYIYCLDINHRKDIYKKLRWITICGNRHFSQPLHPISQNTRFVVADVELAFDRDAGAWHQHLAVGCEALGEGDQFHLFVFGY